MAIDQETATIPGVIIMTPDQLEQFASKVRSQTLDAIAECLPEMVQSALSPTMTSTEVKKLTGWSGSKLQRLRDINEIEFVQNGRSITYPRRAMLSYLKKLTIEGKFNPQDVLNKYAGKPASLGKMIHRS